MVSLGTWRRCCGCLRCSHCRNLWWICCCSRLGLYGRKRYCRSIHGGNGSHKCFDRFGNRIGTAVVSAAMNSSSLDDFADQGDGGTVAVTAGSAAFSGLYGYGLYKAQTPSNTTTGRGTQNPKIKAAVQRGQLKHKEMDYSCHPPHKRAAYARYRKLPQVLTCGSFSHVFVLRHIRSSQSRIRKNRIPYSPPEQIP